ncbi:MAG: flagellar biosynthetic protein FliR [Proteobacteria bacterium]|nr:flagellar biosynthetic protein FliR [Pseudomonadota bacterium]
MLAITSAQLDALLLAWVYPIARVLGMLGTAPVFRSAGAPRKIRLALGLVIGAAIASVLPPPPPIQPGTWFGMGVFVQQILIGTGMGLGLRIVMSAVDIAGSIIGFQMGLSFASFFDPNSSGQTAVLSEFLGLLNTLTFLALNGHLLMINVLVHSFELAPIGGVSITGPAWLVLIHLGSMAFASGLLIALPIITALLITNIALAVLTRAAPQLNLFAIGFPITSTIGLLVILLSLNAFAPVLQNLYDQGFDVLSMFLKALPAR